MAASVMVETNLGPDGRVTHVILNRPDALNAIDSDMARQLADACESLATDEDTWVVILRGAGTRAFCAGADVKARGGFTDDEWLEQRVLFRHMFSLVRAIPQPVIGAVQGFALGGGAELAMLTDVIVAAEDAQFGLTEAHLGIIPGGGGTQSLARLVGRQKAKEMIFTARRVGAAEAHAIGLVSEVVPTADLLGHANSLAARMLANSPLSLRQAKWAINQGVDLPFNDGIEREHEAYMRVITSEDRREGTAAFNEKRMPHFSGR